MQSNTLKVLIIIFFLSIILNIFPTTFILAKTTRVTFENGMEVIFQENHSSPMITSIVFIRAGAKYENEFNNGITHFLEHLLFDGTKNRSREDLSGGIDYHGGYINAFTQKGLTAFLVLMPKEYIRTGIEIQADQLFNSIFPDEEMLKERKIVIEEIQQSNDREADLANRFFNAKTMAGTAYERSVLGYKNIIASISKEKIIEYWKQFYSPNNMISLVIGDFDTDKMIEMYKSVFGVIPPVDLPGPPIVNYYPPTDKKIFKTFGNTKQTYISIAIDAPHFTDPDYYSFDLLTEYLNSDASSPLASQLVDETGAQLYQSFSASLETQEEFSRLVIDVIADNPARADTIIGIIDGILTNYKNYQPTLEILNGIKISKKTNEIYLREKLHYYGFIIAPLLVTTGYDFLENYPAAIEKTNLSMIGRAVERWLTDLKYMATVFYPEQKNDEDKTVVSHTEYRKKILPNGLTLVVKSNTDSRVFALNVIGKNRSASEPQGKDGITDFLNRLIKKGTTTRDAKQLGNQLANIGAKVTVHDNPWIPYDDFFTTRQFAFMKFETIDEFTESGLNLFSDMILNPAIDSANVEKVRGEMMGIIGRQSGSTLNVSRNLYYSTLFEEEAYARSIYGTSLTIGSISREDLTEYHRKFYSSGNMIITVGTNYNADTMMTMLVNAFGDMPAIEYTSTSGQAGIAPSGIKTAHQDMEKEQVYIFIGNQTPGANHKDAPSIRLAASILSERLAQNLREKQGLAYSVGAGVTFDENFGWFSSRIGTGTANIKIARDGIIAEIKKLGKEGPTSEELEIAKNSIWGSSLTRRLSRINQVYYMGVGEYLGMGYDYYDNFVTNLRAVSVKDVKTAAEKYFDEKNCVITTAGKL